MKKLKLIVAMMSLCLVSAFSVHAMQLSETRGDTPFCECLVAVGHGYCPGVFNYQVPGGCQIVPCRINQSTNPF